MKIFDYQLVACDTDSIKFCKKDGSPMTEDEMEEVLDAMDSSTPDGIKLEQDGYYPGFLVVKSKNYVTFDGKKYKFRGSSMVDAKKEPAFKVLLKEIIHEIMESGDQQKLVDIYNKYCLLAVKCPDINQFTTKKTVTNAVFTSTRKNETKVLDACNYAIEQGIINGIQEGDKVWIYQSLDGTLKFPELFQQDHDTNHFLKRCWNTINILKNVIDMNLFPKYHLKKIRQQLDSLEGR